MIYMDYQSTTPIDPRVAKEVCDCMKNVLGNPSSVSHSLGWHAKDLVEKARLSISDLIGAGSKDIVFTSGATESNNIAIKSVARFYKSDKKNHLITTNIEHKCVIESFRALEEEGFEVTYLNPDKDGLISAEQISNAITEKTILLSVIAVHNETGVIQDIETIGKIANQKGILFHTDGAQAFGKIEINVDKMNIDLMSISGHKIYGPMGIGALYVRRKPRVHAKPLFSGGGQERGIRSGTLPTPLIVGFGKAAEIAKEEMKKDQEHVKILGERFLSGIEKIEEVKLNGHKIKRYYGNWNFSFFCVEGESLMMAMPEIAVSSGSACTSKTLETSYVLHAMGLSDDLAHSSIRVGIGRFTTKEDVDITIEKITQAVKRLRELSPLWEMHKEGIDFNSIEWADH